MNRIIVTIRIKQKKEYDLELPVNQKIKDLMQDISDSLEGLDPLASFDPEQVSLVDQRSVYGTEISWKYRDIDRRMYLK